MADFICKKEQVREILDYHELKCSYPTSYTKFSEFLDTLPDTFPYNDFCGKLSGFVSNKLDRGAYEESRFKNGLIERMRRYKVDGD